MATKITMTKWPNGRGVDLLFEVEYGGPPQRVSLGADAVEQLRDLLADFGAEYTPIYARVPQRTD